MQIKASYRLSSYRITEYENGLLWWETHFDFGKQRGGECFICENILIFKTWSQEKDGLLIGEFLDRLKKLPPWEKTLYYCFASELSDVRTGGRLAADQLKPNPFGMNRQGLGKDGPQDPGAGSFRISRYWITISEKQVISWQTLRDMDKIISGPGLIESGVLFLEPSQGGEINRSRHDFFFHLSRLPQWAITKAWCRYPALRFCREQQKSKSEGKKPVQPEKIHRSLGSGLFTASPQNQKKDVHRTNPFPDYGVPKSLKFFSTWSNKLKRPKFSWTVFSGKKIWIPGLIALLFSGLILATILISHELGEKSYRPYWYKKQYHEHRDEHHSRWRFPAILSILLLSLISFLAIYGEAKAEEKHIILEESGIHYPGGFDLNTVGEVRGKASHFSHRGRGPVYFLLASERELYTILTSPPWYWEENNIKIAEGAEVLVNGSKSFGKDGKLYIIAQELRITSSGQHFVFRGKEGAPLWKDHPSSGRETPGGFGPNSGGRGGLGGMGGSRGHGRR